MKKYIIVISGATATGKSDFAIKLAKQVGGEIVNADIGSWYKPLTIGTAKPDWRTESVPHHMFDILDQPQQFNVIRFRNMVQKVAQEIWSRGHVPIVVGGSAFYIKSLWYHNDDLFTFKDDEQKVEQELSGSDRLTQDLWGQLQQIDPARAARIYNNDRYRIVRALSIYKVTGQLASKYEPVFDPIAPMVGIVCVRDRQELYHRIDERVVIMLQSGWIKEVEALLDTPWEQFLLEKKIIGYDDIVRYLKSDRSIEAYGQLVSLIQQKTRNYAKRQVTFLKKLKNDVDTSLQQTQPVEFIEEMNLTLCDVGLYINGLSNRLLQIFG